MSVQVAPEYAVDAYGVYWSVYGDLRMQPHGAAEPVTLFQGPPSIMGLALDEDAIYFSSAITTPGSAAVFRIQRDGSGLTTLVSGLSAASLWEVSTPVLDSERVYYPNTTGHIASVTKLGGEPAETSIEVRALRGLTIDDSHFYWLEGDDHASALKRMPKTGGGAELLLSGLKNALFPSVVGDSVFFVSERGIVEVPKIGGCARALVWHEPVNRRIVGLAFDADQIYFKSWFAVSGGMSSIFRAPVTGGVAVQLTSDELVAGFSGVVLYAGRAYWTTDQGVRTLEL